ncbi:TPA: hypothetical protein KDY05_002241 [Vibrio parahaemolyticus]|nr:hypothetical protein [Vibrio parahaemolyticus]
MKLLAMIFKNIPRYLKLVFFGIESRYMQNGDSKKSVNFAFHALCFVIALLLSPMYQPNVKIIGVTSGRGPGAGGDFLSILMLIVLTAILYAARYRGNFKTKPTSKVAREYNVRSATLLFIYCLFFYSMPVINNYRHYGILYFNPFELLVIDGS